MNLPGLLVEYLINGCVALIWLLKLSEGKINLELDEPIILILIPIVYVIGMFIDVIAWALTYPMKNVIRKRALNGVAKEMKTEGKEFNIDEYRSFWDEKALIEMKYPTLASDLKSRSSRDRIARGTMINLIPITILFWNQISFVGVAMFFISMAIWYYFEFYSRSGEIRAAKLVRSNVNIPS